jgi:hypothetical protein
MEFVQKTELEGDGGGGDKGTWNEHLVCVYVSMPRRGAENNHPILINNPVREYHASVNGWESNIRR